jgi:caffeoyl-CoA O-methyltransferase
VITIMDVTASAETVSDYLLAHSTAQDEVLARLAEETRTTFADASGMQISADEGALLTMLVRLTGARNAVEVGTFTGYSSICIARGLADGGRLLACDVSGEWTDVARRYWAEAGVEDRIDLRLAPAVETLAALPAEQTVDFAFVDADKESYPTYYEELVGRLRPGGLVVLDNVLLGGRVLDEAEQGERAQIMRSVNDRVAADDRVDAVMLPVRDGVTVARRREDGSGAE